MPEPASSPNSQSHLRSKLSMRKRISWISGLGLGLSLIVGLFITQQEHPQAVYECSSWEEAKLLALGEQMNCLVLFNAPYCYPCQRWEQKLRSEEAFTYWMKGQFACYQFDGFEPYSEGPKLVQQYKITSYPTYLLTDAMGQEIGRFSPRVDELDLWKEWVRSEGKGALQASTKSKRSESKETSWGLVETQVDGWEQAKVILHVLGREWNRDLWVQQDETQKWTIVRGTFGNRETAEQAQAVIEMMESKETQVVKLIDEPLELVLASEVDSSLYGMKK